ncbi:hypothetical protein ACG7TL_006796 [Trametes sanguinea]
MGRAQPVISGDVYLELLAAADRPEVASMMCASRFLYSEGSKAILRDPVAISSQQHLSRFLVFLLAEGPRRLQFVRSLQLHMTPPSANDDLFQRLFVAIRGMSQLRSLSIAVHSERQLVDLIALVNIRAERDGNGAFDALHTLILDVAKISAEASLALIAAVPNLSSLRALSIPNGDLLFDSHPSLASAFAELPSIQKIDMPCIFEGGVSMLRGLRSNLVSAKLDFLPYGDDAFFDNASNTTLRACHPAKLLAHSQSSLEELYSYGWKTHPDILPDTSAVYPKMRTLELENAGYPLTMAYIRAYPNLTRLRYQTLESDKMTYDRESIESYDIRHRLNVTAQLASGCTWSQLQEYSGSVVDLYMLGLTCPIDNIHLDLGTRALCYQLLPVLSHTRPRHLQFYGWPGNPSGPAEEVFSVFCGEAGSHLESFELNTALCKGDEDVDLPAIMDALKSALTHTPVQELRFTISLTELDNRPDSTSTLAMMRRQRWRLPTPPPLDPTAYPLCAAERSAEDFDLQLYVNGLQDAIATLVRAQITLRGPRDSWRQASLASGQLHYERH